MFSKRPEIGWLNVTTAQVVQNRPCILWQLALTDDGTGNALGTIYNGHNANAKESFMIRAIQHFTRQLYFPGGLFLSKGLFVDPTTKVGSFLIRSEAQ